MLVVFGEDPGKVQRTLEDRGYTISDVSHSREFHSLLAEGKTKFPVVIAGLGSASVECVLSELSILRDHRGMKYINLVHAGTCGSSPDYKIGQPVVVDKAQLNNEGAQSFYTADKTYAYPSKALMEEAKKLKIPRGTIISSDAFYGYGCLLAEQGGKEVPVYSGPKLRSTNPPPGFLRFREVYNRFLEHKEPYLVDMETAFLYSLSGQMKGVESVSIKGVSNHIPFNPSNYIGDEDKALGSSLEQAVRLLEHLNKA